MKTALCPLSAVLIGSLALLVTDPNKGKADDRELIGVMMMSILVDYHRSIHLPPSKIYQTLGRIMT
jgi:hypothetical protein